MLRIARILVPTDFSEASDTALVHAKAFAERFGASMHLLHVFEDPFVPGALSADGQEFLPTSLRQSLMDDATARLGERLAQAAPLPHCTTELVAGPVAKSIVEFASDRNIDLIVMGTHGRGAVAHLLLGSVAERVVRMAPCPVLTVRQAAVPAHAEPVRADQVVPLVSPSPA